MSADAVSKESIAAMRRFIAGIRWAKMSPEEQRVARLCRWATEVLRRRCPVYWL